MNLKKDKDIRADERKKVVEEVWEMLKDFRKYTPHTIGADTDIIRAKLRDIAGCECELEI